MDDADIAQAAADQHMKVAMENIRQSIPRGGESNKWCEDCGDRIPEKRRAAVPGCTRCVRCQTEFDDEFGWY